MFLFVTVAHATVDRNQYLCRISAQSSNCTMCQVVCQDSCFQSYIDCGPALTTCQTIKAACDQACQDDQDLCQLVLNAPTAMDSSTVDKSSFPTDTCPELEVLQACAGTDLAGLYEGSFIPVAVPSECQGSTDNEDLSSTLSGETPLYRSFQPDSLDEDAKQFRYTYLYKSGNVRWTLKHNVVLFCDPPPEETDQLLVGTGEFIAGTGQPHLSTASSILCTGKSPSGQAFAEETTLELCCLTTGEGNTDTCVEVTQAPNAAPSAKTPSTDNGGSTTPQVSSSATSSKFWLFHSSLWSVVLLVAISWFQHC